MKSFDVSRLPPMITLGYDGENNWRPQAFDCTPLLQNHPNGTISLWLLPNGETQAFPVALTRNGNSVVWTPLSEEMTAATGALQLVCTDGTDVGKSKVIPFRVDESILPGADHPAAVPSWSTQTIERAEAAAERAEEAAESIDVEHLEQTIAAAVEAYLIEHPVQAPVESVNGKTGAVRLDASDVGALPSDTVIPPAVTEQTVAGWGFTKNTGTYVKPSTGIPASDLAFEIPTVPQTAVYPNMQDWTEGKVVDALTLRTVVTSAAQQVAAKADASSVYTKTEVDQKLVGAMDYKGTKATVSALPASGNETGDVWHITADGSEWAWNGSAWEELGTAVDLSGYATETYVQTQIANIPDELPAVTSTDNGKFLRVVSGAWAAQAVPSAESNSFGGGA